MSKENMNTENVYATVTLSGLTNWAKKVQNSHPDFQVCFEDLNSLDHEFWGIGNIGVWEGSYHHLAITPKSAHETMNLEQFLIMTKGCAGTTMRHSSGMTYTMLHHTPVWCYDALREKTYAIVDMECNTDAELLILKVQKV